MIGFGAGEPDFPTPDYIVEAAVEACRDPATTATPPPAGCPSSRQAIADKTRRDSGYDVEAGQVLVTNGGKQAVYEAFATLLDPGDEVILPAPYWTTYPEAIRLAGGVPVDVLADETQGYLVTVDQLEAARTDAHQGAAVLLAVQPDRCGLPAEQVRAIGAVGSSTASGWSPTRSTSTWSTATPSHLDRGRGARARRHLRGAQRSGQDLRDDRLAGRLDDRPDRRRQGRRPTCSRTRPPTSPTSPSGPRSPRSPATCARWRDEGGLRPPPADDRGDAQRRRRASSARAEGRVLRLPVGQGRAWPAATARSAETSAELAEIILEQAEVAVVPGEAFGTPGYLRLSYALGDDDLVEGVTRIQKLLA